MPDAPPVTTADMPSKRSSVPILVTFLPPYDSPLWKQRRANVNLRGAGEDGGYSIPYKKN
jgi:hypothetical protein